MPQVQGPPEYFEYNAIYALIPGSQEYSERGKFRRDGLVRVHGCEYRVLDY